MLEQSGQVDADEAALIRKLATQGFGIAQTQSEFKAQLQSISKLVVRPGVYAETIDSFKAKTSNVGRDPVNADLLKSMAAHPSGSALSAGDFTPAMADYVNTYSEINRLGIMQDPAVGQVIEGAYTEILRSNHTLILAAEEKKNYLERTESGVVNRIRDSLFNLDKDASKAIRETQGEANTICGTGHGDGSSQIQCIKRG